MKLNQSPSHVAHHFHVYLIYVHTYTHVYTIYYMASPNIYDKDKTISFYHGKYA